MLKQGILVGAGIQQILVKIYKHQRARYQQYQSDRQHHGDKNAYPVPELMHGKNLRTSFFFFRQLNVILRDGFFQ